MKRLHLSIAATAVLCIAAALTGADQPPQPDTPRYNTNGELLLPANYREWIFLSSGLGMNYGPMAAMAGDENPPFDNVFVAPAAYRSFLQTGHWPDKAILVLELRRAFGLCMVTALARIEGKPLGIVANNPTHLAGAIDSDGSDKARASCSSSTRSTSRCWCSATHRG